MDLWRFRSRHRNHKKPARRSYSIYRNMAESEGDPDGLQMKVVEAEATPAGVSAGDGGQKVREEGRCLWQRWWRTMVYVVLVGILVFVVGFLLGYLTPRSSPCSGCGDFMAMVNDDRTYEAEKEHNGALLYWAELRDMFQKYLNEETIEGTIRKMSEAPHPPGSPRLDALSRHVLDAFKSYDLDHSWTDSHYVGLQRPDWRQPNFLHRVDVSGAVLEKLPLGDPDVYCPYSASSTVRGGLVFANYGRQEDFAALKQLGVSPKGHLVLVRVGEISYAEKVANAEASLAKGVLIYPDPSDVLQGHRKLGLPPNMSIYGHVHMGAGDPYSPGFPSFNHTQFPPTQSSGLPKIPAHPISANVAAQLLRHLVGPTAPEAWKGRLPDVPYRLGPSEPGFLLQLGVQNIKQSVMINNIFGCIEGRFEPDHYLIVGAQRDSLGPGAARSGVGTAILLELARTFTAMVQNGFQLRRSLLFVSWDAGDFGSVGSTEWLEDSTCYLTDTTDDSRWNEMIEARRERGPWVQEQTPRTTHLSGGVCDREKKADEVGSSASNTQADKENREKYSGVTQHSKIIETEEDTEEVIRERWRPSDITKGFLAVVNKAVTWEMVKEEMEGLCITSKEVGIQTEEVWGQRRLVRERGVQTDSWGLMNKDKKVQVGGRFGDLAIRTHGHAIVQVNRDLEKEVRMMAVQTEDRICCMIFKEVGVQTDRHVIERDDRREGGVARGRASVKDVREGIPCRRDIWRKVETGLPLPTPDLTLRFTSDDSYSVGGGKGKVSDPNPEGWIPGWGWNKPQGTQHPCYGGMYPGSRAVQPRQFPR